MYIEAIHNFNIINSAFDQVVFLFKKPIVVNLKVEIRI